MGIWENFEGMVTAEEVTEAKENTFAKFASGNYNCEIISIECGVTTQNQPIVKFKFKEVDSNRLLGTNLFLTNQNYPERTPTEIVKCLNFIKSVTGEELTFTSFGKFEADVLALPMGKLSVLEVKYRNETAKYPDVYFVEDYVEMPFK